jgi:hypothetical protein
MRPLTITPLLIVLVTLLVSARAGAEQEPPSAETLAPLSDFDPLTPHESSRLDALIEAAVRTDPSDRPKAEPPAGFGGTDHIADGMTRLGPAALPRLRKLLLQRDLPLALRTTAGQAVGRLQRVVRSWALALSPAAQGRLRVALTRPLPRVWYVQQPEDEPCGLIVSSITDGVLRVYAADGTRISATDVEASDASEVTVPARGEGQVYRVEWHADQPQPCSLRATSARVMIEAETMVGLRLPASPDEAPQATVYHVNVGDVAHFRAGLQALDTGDHGLLVLAPDGRPAAATVFFSDETSGIHCAPGSPCATLRVDVPKHWRGQVWSVVVAGPQDVVLRLQGLNGLLSTARDSRFDVPANLRGSDPREPGTAD